jgi:3-keto-5-aminohexanoate cleavage enzyme
MAELVITLRRWWAELTRNTHTCRTSEETAWFSFRVDAGAAMVHIHARDAEGAPTQDLEDYRRIIEAVRISAPDVIVQVSTGGAVWMKPEERLQPLALQPDMASLTTGTVNFGEEVFSNSMPMVRNFQAMQDGHPPELEILTRMIPAALRLLKEGLLNERLLQSALGCRRRGRHDQEPAAHGREPASRMHLDDQWHRPGAAPADSRSHHARRPRPRRPGR